MLNLKALSTERLVKLCDERDTALMRTTDKAERNKLLDVRQGYVEELRSRGIRVKDFSWARAMNNLSKSWTITPEFNG